MQPAKLVIETCLQDLFYLLFRYSVTMQSEQKMLIKTCLHDLILLANCVAEAVDQAKSYRINCRKMGKQMFQLLQMLDTLLDLIALDPILLYLNSLHRVISEVTGFLQEALNLACKCRRKTIFCRLFTGTQTICDFHKLYHLFDVCNANMNWLLLIYNPDFNSAFNEIALSLPQILNNDSSIPSAWSRMVTEDVTWELETKLSSSDVGILEGLLLCLAKLVGTEHGELQDNCLVTIMEITAAAELNLDLRRKVFKPTSPSSKAIVEQVLRVIKESEDPKLQVLAIKSIGSLARTFYERENHHVIDVLVSQLDNEHQEVVMEAIVALTKFACEENYLCKAHSRRMIELNAVPPLVKLLRYGESTVLQQHGLELMCYLGLNADYSEAIEQAWVLTAIQQLLTRKRGRRTVVSRRPEFKEDLVDKALQCLTLY